MALLFPVVCLNRERKFEGVSILAEFAGQPRLTLDRKDTAGTRKWWRQKKGALADAFSSSSVRDRGDGKGIVAVLFVLYVSSLAFSAECKIDSSRQ